MDQPLLPLHEAPEGSPCAVARDLLSRVGDKWSVSTIVQLGQGPQRFSALRRANHGISQRMLTQTLRRLERDGVAWREVQATMPITVTYGLTPIGEDLLTVLEPFFRWCQANHPAISEARARFDAKAIAAGEAPGD